MMWFSYRLSVSPKVLSTRNVAPSVVMRKDGGNFKRWNLVESS
jgi:hypothetical protein